MTETVTDVTVDVDLTIEPPCEMRVHATDTDWHEGPGAILINVSFPCCGYGKTRGVIVCELSWLHAPYIKLRCKCGASRPALDYWTFVRRL